MLCLKLSSKNKGKKVMRVFGLDIGNSFFHCAHFTYFPTSQLHGAWWTSTLQEKHMPLTIEWICAVGGEKHWFVLLLGLSLLCAQNSNQGPIIWLPSSARICVPAAEVAFHWCESQAALGHRSGTSAITVAFPQGKHTECLLRMDCILQLEGTNQQLGPRV